VTTELDAGVFVSFDEGSGASLDPEAQAPTPDAVGEPAPGEDDEQELDAFLEVVGGPWPDGNPPNATEAGDVARRLAKGWPKPAEARSFPAEAKVTALRRVRRDRRWAGRLLANAPLRQLRHECSTTAQSRPREHRPRRAGSSRASPSGDPDPEPDHVARPLLAGEARAWLKGELDRRARAALVAPAALDRDLFAKEVAPT
jgi:hypothetical protein